MNDNVLYHTYMTPFGEPAITPPSPASRRRRVPYHEIDPGIVPLVRVLNRLPHIVTTSSCSGHRAKGRNSYYVLLETTRPKGLRSIEFVAWAVFEFNYC